MFKNLFFFLMIIAGIQLFGGCNCSSKKTSNSSEDELLTTESFGSDASSGLSDGKFEDVIQNISSPVEMATLIKSTGVEFSQKLLNTPEKTDEYSSNYKRALNLGVYSTDLGYINTFDKNNIVVPYLLSIKQLAEGIKIGQFFDFAALKETASNSNNLDSLMQLSISSFNKMDSYLRDQNRGGVSSLIVAGAWIEGLYIAGSVVEETKNEELINRIAEQKDVVDILMATLKSYNSDQNFAELTAQMEQLKEVYSGIKITPEAGEPKRIEKDGSIIIVQDEINKVEITPGQISEIINQIGKLREFIVS